MNKPTIPAPPKFREPRIAITVTPCVHNFVFLRSEFEMIEGTYNSHYSQTDVFYCIGCLEYRKVIARQVDHRFVPDWYRP